MRLCISISRVPHKRESDFAVTCAIYPMEFEFFAAIFFPSGLCDSMRQLRSNCHWAQFVHYYWGVILLEVGHGGEMLCWS